MATFGQKLKQERERRGLRLEEISEVTRVRVKHLEALERGDFDALPQDVFVKGFLRTYADYVGADADALVEEYLHERHGTSATGEAGEADEVVQKMARILAEPRQKQPRDLRRIAGLVLAGLGALVLFGAWWILRPTDGPAVQPPRSTPASSAAVPSREPEVTTVARREEPTVRHPDVSPTPALPPPVEVEPPSDPAPEPEPAPVAVTPTIEPEPGPVSVSDYGVGSGIRNRQLVGRAESFPEGERVWFWTRVLGAERGGTIRHVWKHQGHGSSSVELELGGDHWRTQSSKTLFPGSAGRWWVEARDAGGAVLARQEFVCVPPE